MFKLIGMNEKFPELGSEGLLMHAWRKKMDCLQGLSGLNSHKWSLTPGFGATESYWKPLRPPSESVSSGSFDNLKLTAAKLVKEQASAETDLELAMEFLSLRLESLEETIKREEEQSELLVAGEMELIETEENEKQFGDEQCRVSSLVEEKDIVIKNFEETVVVDGLTVENLNSQLKEENLELQSKDVVLNNLRESKENLEKEKADVMSSYRSFSCKLDMAVQEIRKLEDFVNMMGKSLAEFDNQHLNVSEKIVHPYDWFDTWFKLFQEEKFHVNQHAQERFNQLHDQILHAASEKDASQLVKEDLVSKVGELKNEKQCTMVQHAEECCLAEEMIQKLRTETETVISNKTELQTVITILEEEIGSLSAALRLPEQSLMMKFSELEVENKDNSRKLQSEIQHKEEEIDFLKKEIRKLVDSLGCIKIQKLLADAESNVLKEISQRNDKSINDIQRKYEVEKMESIDLEKKKQFSVPCLMLASDPSHSNIHIPNERMSTSGSSVSWDAAFDKSQLEDQLKEKEERQNLVDDMGIKKLLEDQPGGRNLLIIKKEQHQNFEVLVDAVQEKQRTQRICELGDPSRDFTGYGIKGTHHNCVLLEKSRSYIQFDLGTFELVSMPPIEQSIVVHMDTFPVAAGFQQGFLTVLMWTSTNQVSMVVHHDGKNHWDYYARILALDQNTHITGLHIHSQANEIIAICSDLKVLGVSLDGRVKRCPYVPKLNFSGPPQPQDTPLNAGILIKERSGGKKTYYMGFRISPSGDTYYSYVELSPKEGRRAYTDTRSTFGKRDLLVAGSTGFMACTKSTDEEFVAFYNAEVDNNTECTLLALEKSGMVTFKSPGTIKECSHPPCTCTFGWVTGGYT